MKKNILAAFLFAGFIALNAAPPAGQWKSMNWKNTAVSYEKETLNLEIKQAQKFHGGAVLTILKTEPDKTFVFSAEVTSPEPDVAYLSVKLYESIRKTGGAFRKVPDKRCRPDRTSGPDHSDSGYSRYKSHRPAT